MKTKLNNPATKDLSMGPFKITNLATPKTRENDTAINISFFNTELNESNTNMSTQLTNAYKKSHLKPSGQQTDVFRYLMEDEDESSSESNIKVTGIKDWPSSPHNTNKKAYEFTLTKDNDGSNNYRSRISFNIVGSYTFIIVYFPPEMRNVSVSAQSTTAYVNKQSSKNFKNYVKHLVQFLRWGSSPPQYLFIDLHGYSSSNNPVGRMIVYGVKEHVNEVDPSVYDTVYAVENGKMVMQTDIDMNNYKINVPQFITGHYNKSKHSSRIFLNGLNPFQIIPYDCHLTEITCYFYETQSSNFQITLNVRSAGKNNQNQSFNSTQNKRQQNFTVNIQLSKKDILWIEIYKQGTRDDIAPGGRFSSLFFAFKMKDVFEFNHIDKNLTEDQILTLKDYYKHYHKKFWCFKKYFKKIQSLDQIIAVAGAVLVIIGTITGGITLNSIILGVVNGIGLLISSIGKMKNYKKKIHASMR